MRLLLIDNHDSFTAILHHYLWELTGERPLLYRNDELTREELERLAFDAAVLSPGPGHPANVRDFGISRDLLELFPATPVLGVCLGMQGLAWFAGGRVVPWDGALHGRPSRIAHDGSGVFRGLPQGFRAIRYHSLIVDPDSLPPSVRVTARASAFVGEEAAAAADAADVVGAADAGEADDPRGTHVMGLAFTDRPWHGVQFHPEAFDTEHGKALLANFIALARGPAAASGFSPAAPADRPGSTNTRGPAQSPPKNLPVIPHVELPWRDPAAVFVRFFAGLTETFWLDGAHARPDSGWASTAMGRASATLPPDPTLFRAGPIAAGEERACPWPGYRGGPVGQFDYEWRADDSEGRRAGRWLVPDGWLSFDHAAGRVFAAWNEGAQPPTWLGAVIGAWSDPAAPVHADPLQSSAMLPPRADWTTSLTAPAHADAVARLQDAIARGESYEACLTFRSTVEGDVDPLGVYLRLRARNPAPYAAYLVFNDCHVLCSSPELFLEGSDAGVLRSRPIKGTRRRGLDEAEDRALRTDLASSQKDAAENRMITDLTRHDLARVCVPGSVEVPRFLTVEAYPAVFQLVSEVRGRLASGCDAFDAVVACFPGGSMTGAPKERTMEILRAVEARPRGVYSGALGYFTRGGAFTLSMVIRTVVRQGPLWSTGCGGAVLADSDAESEWREALLKAGSVIDAVGP